MYEIMKRYILYLILLWLAGGFFTACEKEEPPFFDSKANGVYFDYAEQRELSASVNFADHVLDDPDYLPVKIRIKVLGYLSDESRQIVLKSKAVEGYPEVGVILPEIKFEAGEIKKEIEVKVAKPATQGTPYAICVYIDAADPSAQLGAGIEGFEEFIVYVKEEYEKPAGWDWGIGYYLGEWNIEKHVFMIRVTRNNDYAKSRDWGEYMQFNVQAVNALRQFRQDHPSEKVTIEIPFASDCEYEKPFYWTSLNDRYLGAYSSKTFVNISRMLGATTLNEKELFTGDEVRMKELNKAAVEGMMRTYDNFFSWQYPGSAYRDGYWVPVFSDIDYALFQPDCWGNAEAGAMISQYYGDYSDAKYKFMINTWLAKKGADDFVLVHLFPVIGGWGDDGNPMAQWDESIGGEAQIKECYRTFKAEYDKDPAAYPFTFPEVAV
ncbi:hypothetical protein IX307_000621 [Bacteroides pyogenes]|jgi:hypothetical protein|nr:hypothetical protein [Bacteroides pyogenes]MBR8737797.1 hypothetical protein [Bacteroides pyogenes]MBR8753430.1 hypothetical protein [Bacteroides pyogenes]MBR8786318.1 hypothetical protein [Bacteroides pyogenes]MBR8794896.1 hypothetical protein [Bacteroides pyogenes]